MRLIKKSPELFFAEGDIATISQAEIDTLKLAVVETPHGRCRINLHSASDDKLHEMFIVIQRGSYIRAHKHPNKSEAFHMVYGSARVVIFNDDGDIEKVVHLDANCPKKPFYYRMSKPFFHTLIIESDIMIVHEITNGPFVPGQTIFAFFSPHEDDKEAVRNFQNNLQAELAEWELQ